MHYDSATPEALTALFSHVQPCQITAKLKIEFRDVSFGNVAAK